MTLHDLPHEAILEEPHFRNELNDNTWKPYIDLYENTCWLRVALLSDHVSPVPVVKKKENIGKDHNTPRKTTRWTKESGRKQREEMQRERKCQHKTRREEEHTHTTTTPTSPPE